MARSVWEAGFRVQTEDWRIDEYDVCELYQETYTTQSIRLYMDGMGATAGLAPESFSFFFPSVVHSFNFDPTNTGILPQQAKMMLKPFLALAAAQLAAAQELMRFGCSQLTLDRIDP